MATGNSLLGTTTALPILRARDGVPDWDAVAGVIAEWQPERLLVGEPLNMDGSDSELARRARRFGNRLHGRFGLPVEMFDERLSSREAKSLARESGHRGDYHRAPVDSLAAALILESWLAEQKPL